MAEVAIVLLIVFAALLLMNVPVAVAIGMASLVAVFANGGAVQPEMIVADRMINLGIRGVWNFTNIELSSANPDVKFENIHFADSLLTLSYRIANG